MNFWKTCVQLYLKQAEKLQTDYFTATTRLKETKQWSRRQQTFVSNCQMITEQERVFTQWYTNKDSRRFLWKIEERKKKLDKPATLSASGPAAARELPDFLTLPAYEVLLAEEFAATEGDAAQARL